MELERELSAGDIQIKWNHVDAHCGILGNERADQLARKGSEMYRMAKRQGWLISRIVKSAERATLTEELKES